jgi:EpsD family peptidyl-prolyl cis-trans isomerase
MNPRVALFAGSRTIVTATVAASLFVLMTACGDKKDKPATQTAAKVNKEEITVHQINAVLQQQRGLKPEQADEASRRALERLIDQELAVQKAAELKVDRDPRVVQAIEAARRDIIARAYVEKIGEGATKPTPAEIKKYYDDHPALFKERQVYQLQELAIHASADQIEPLRKKLQASKAIGEFIDYLKANNFKFTANQAVRAAEQLPMAVLPALAKMKDGQAMLNTTPTGAQVVVVAGSRAQPVDEERASRAIEQFLLNERKRKIVADDLKSLRGGAAIAYAGKFAASAPAAAELIKAPTPAEVAASAAATLDTKSITEGLGLKTGAAAASAAELADAAVKPASGVDASSISKGLGLK